MPNIAQITITSGNDSITFTPKSLQQSNESLSPSTAGRNQTGNFVEPTESDVIAAANQKLWLNGAMKYVPKLEITLPSHSVSDNTYRKIMSMVQGQAYWITYYDTLSQEQFTRPFYTPSSSAAVYSGIIRNGMVQDQSFTASCLWNCSFSHVGDITPLATPVLTLSGTTVSWNQVSGASAYTVIDNNVSSIQSVTTYNITTTGESHTIQVKANSNSATRSDSGYASITYTPALTYTITVTASPSAGGTVTGGGNYLPNSTAHLTATPASGYSFVQWNDGNTNSIRDIVVTQSATYTATFVNSSNEVVITVTGDSSATYTGGGTKTKNTSVTIQATNITTGYGFLQWMSNNVKVSENNPYTFTATENKEFYGVVVPYCTINVATTTGGTVSGGGNILRSKPFTIVATPNTHYVFSNWTDSQGNIVSTDATYQYVATQNETYTAHFTQGSAYTVSATIAPASNMGSVTGTGTYYAGETVTLTAVPASGYNFVRWNTGDTTSTLSLPITDHNWNLTAYFASQTTVYVETGAQPADGGTVTGGGEYAPNSSVTITATPNTGFTFNFMIDADNPTQFIRTNPYTFTIGDTNKTYVVRFTEQTVSIDVSAYNTVGQQFPAGTATINGTSVATVRAGSQVTLVANTVEGHSFARWVSDNAGTIGTSATMTYTVGNSNDSIVAIYN